MRGLAHVDSHEYYNATHVFAFVCILPVLTALHIKMTIIGLWEWLIVGVVITNDLTIESNLGELSPQQ